MIDKLKIKSMELAIDVSRLCEQLRTDEFYTQQADSLDVDAKGVHELVQLGIDPAGAALLCKDVIEGLRGLRKQLGIHLVKDVKAGAISKLISGYTGLKSLLSLYK